MSNLDEIPEPWREAMGNAGTYSLRSLATKSGAGTTTVSDLIYGRKSTSENTMQAVADALRLPVTTIREWAAVARGEVGPFVLPVEANRLGRRQREAVLAVVRAMLDPAVDTAAEDQEPITGPEPATVHEFPIAARRGTSEGKRIRQQQDDDADT